MAGHTDDLQQALSRSFDLDLPEQVSKEKIISALAFRVEKMIAGNPDQLFSLLYRLDIAESKIKAAMHVPEGLPIKIAALIYERQEEKMISRKQFKADRPNDDLAW